MDSDDEWEEEEPGESLSDCHSAVSMIPALAVRLISCVH